MTNLEPKQVHYLSFEGGGGKGIAYLGALAALAEKNIGIMEPIKTDTGETDYVLGKQIKGISGSSAGSITAGLLASGFTLFDLMGFSKNSTLLGSFYDMAKPRQVLSLDGGAPGCGTWQFPRDPLVGAILLIIFDLLTNKIPTWFNKDLPKAIKERINLEPQDYAKNLYYDYGLFSGCAFYRYAESELGLRTGKKILDKRMPVKIDDNLELTFRRFFQVHEIDLVLTGTNIETMESQYFSVKKTPDFRVVDAMRISMSFPFAYKPIFIHRGPYKGTWIDGGVMNNNPMHAFDDPDGKWNKNVLSLRLEIDERNRIDNFGDFLLAVLRTVRDNSEKLQIRSPQEKEQTIELPTDGLSTLDFTPPVDVIKRSVENSAARVSDYFGKGIFTEVINQVLDNI